MRLFAISRNATPGLPRIMRCKSSLIKPCSYTGLFKNTLRTGTLKNRSRITIVVPSGQPVSLTPIKRPPSISTFAPASASFVRVVIVTCETRRDRRQRLAAEAQRANVEQPVGVLQLARGVVFKRHSRFREGNTAAVVRYAQIGNGRRPESPR